MIKGMSTGMRLFIILCIFVAITTVVVVRGQSAGPNAIASINGQTTLDCNTFDLSLSNWRHSPDGSNNFVTIANGCIVTGNNGAYYRTEIPGGNICRLIIANVTMQQAGVYVCYNGGSNVYRSLVTVIDQVASVVVYNQSEVVEGDHLNITCSINYNAQTQPAPSLRPLPYWATSPGQIFTNATYHPSTSVVTLISTVTVQKYTVPIFQCGTVFEITGNTSGYNSTAPSDDFEVGRTTELDVQYPVETISISSTVSTEDNCVYKTETLTCTADANPQAQYKWLDMNNNITITGAAMSISSGGEYQCTASNSIRNQIYSEKKNVTETSCHSPYNLTTIGTNCENNFCTCSGNASDADPISVTCMANGIPIPSVEWRSDNSFDGLDETIGVSINGNYTCTASNTYGGKPYSEELTVVVYDCHDPLPYTLSPSTVATALEPGSKDSYRTSGTRSSKRRVRSNHSLRNTASEESLVGAFIGMLIGVIVIVLNIVAACLFFWYYKKVEVSQSGKMKRNNKLKLDRRFPWLKKMMPCVSDTKESAGSNCLWVSLFILLGIVTGIVTFPIFILLAKKYEKNNETSALNRRENGEGNGSGENGRRPTNVSLANHNQPPSTNQMNPIRQEGPYQNESSRENIELNNSLRSRKLLLPDSQPSRPPPAGRPPPPPNKPTMNLSTNRSKDYTVNDPQKQAANPEHTTYADLPFVPRNTLPTATPVQFLNVSNDTYASLNKT